MYSDQYPHRNSRTSRVIATNFFNDYETRGNILVYFLKILNLNVFSERFDLQSTYNAKTSPHLTLFVRLAKLKFYIFVYHRQDFSIYSCQTFSLANGKSEQQISCVQFQDEQWSLFLSLINNFRQL